MNAILRQAEHPPAMRDVECEKAIVQPEARTHGFQAVQSASEKGQQAGLYSLKHENTTSRLYAVSLMKHFEMEGAPEGLVNKKWTQEMLCMCTKRQRTTGLVRRDLLPIKLSFSGRRFLEKARAIFSPWEIERGLGKYYNGEKLITF